VRGDLPILAALLGVGVVVSPLVSGRAGEAATLALEAAPRSMPARAEPPVLAAETRAPATPAPIAPPAEPVRRASRPAAVVVEGTPDAPLTGSGAVAAIADRPFALVVGEAGLARPTRVDGAFALDGRPTLVHVAASWCAPCVDELPTFLALAERAPRVVWVAAEDVAGPSGLLNVVEALVAKAEPTSRALPRGLELRADPAWAWSAWLGRETLPLTAVLDARGGLVMVAEGALDEDAAARVLAHLGEAP